MSRRDCIPAFRTALTALLAMICGAAILPAGSASAQLFDFLFRGQHYAPPPDPYAPPRAHPPPSVYAPPHIAPGSPRRARAAYCVRLCDGFYFPLQGRSGSAAAELCNAFCPASETRVYFGDEIEHAVAEGGRRYRDLRSAYVFQARAVADCTCNRKSSFGLAQIPPAADPTLEPGDIVAMNSGLNEYRGGDPQVRRSFAPIESAGLSRSIRNQLAGVRVLPGRQGEDAMAKASPQRPRAVSRDGRRLSVRER